MGTHPVTNLKGKLNLAGPMYIGSPEINHLHLGLRVTYADVIIVYFHDTSRGVWSLQRSPIPYEPGVIAPIFYFLIAEVI